jgi:hypothetical protein
MAEHPPELERLDGLRERRDVVADRRQRRVVVVVAGQPEQLGAVGEAAVELGQRPDDALEGLLFLAELLGARGVAPDLRILERAADFLERLRLAVEVKATSASRRPGPSGRRACGRAG